MTQAQAELVRKTLAGDRRGLAKVITLLESRRSDDRLAAEALLAALVPHARPSLRLGISGSPGVGKSSFIEAFGTLLLAAGHRLAVLAIDPSSPLSGGSILGDRVRMEELSRHPQAFIRPTPSAGTLGGAARNTREVIIACEAAGFDIIIVETVGVGQSETAVATMVDLFLVLHLPHAGDEIQGIKRGILELADLVAITKADGELLASALRAQGELAQALHFSRHADVGVPRVSAVSSVTGAGLSDLWSSICTLAAHRRSSGDFTSKRQTQALTWFRDEISEHVLAAVMRRPALAEHMRAAEARVASGQSAPSVAARQLVDSLVLR